MAWIFFIVMAILFVFIVYFDGIGFVSAAISDWKSANFDAEMERVFSAYIDTNEDELYEEVF